MDVFSALADPTRRKIVEMLAKDGRLSASEIYSHFSMSAPAISQHLKVLQEAHLVQVEKRAQQRIYQVNPEAVLEVEGWARKMRELQALWDERFDALDRVLAAEKRKMGKDQNTAGNPQEGNDGKVEPDR